MSNNQSLIPSSCLIFHWEISESPSFFFQDKLTSFLNSKGPLASYYLMSGESPKTGAEYRVVLFTTEVVGEVYAYSLMKYWWAEEFGTTAGYEREVQPIGV